MTRPAPRRRAVAVVATCVATCVLVAGLGGCGADGTGSAQDLTDIAPSQAGTVDDAASEAPMLFDGCSADAAEIDEADVATRAALEPGGATQPVRLVQGATQCSNALVVGSQPRAVGLDLGTVQLDPATLRAVQLIHGPALLVGEQVNPRGGFQTHLYAVAGGTLREVTLAGGNAPVPFVATDTSPGDLTAVRCVDVDGTGGFEVVTATPTGGSGGEARYRIVATGYRVDGATATRRYRQPTEAPVTRAVVQRDYPDLVDHRVLDNCSDG